MMGLRTVSSFFKIGLCLVAATMLSACDQVHVGFTRFQLVNHTPHEITYFAVARSQRAMNGAPNQLSAPLAPGAVANVKVSGPGRYWLLARASVAGGSIERSEGPVRIFEGNKAWVWRGEGDEIVAGTGARDIYAVSDLPTVVFNTNGQRVVDDPKVVSWMHIAHDPEGGLNTPLGAPVDFAGVAGIEIRGNSSQTFDKNSFGVETWDENLEGVDISPLGFPEEEDWVFHGPWMDRSLVRNAFGYALWEDMGYYGPRTRFVEVYLNTTNNPVVEETYHGLYLLTEKVKRNRNRVNISRLGADHVDEPDISGGYILEMQARDQLAQGELSIPVAGGFVIAVEYPRPWNITEIQAAWISNYIAEFEAMLFGPDFADPELGYSAWIDVDNFIDYILFQDLSKNRDAFRSSTWFSKDRNDVLRLGPVWDMNIAYGYFSFSGFQSPEGWFLQGPKGDLPHSPWTDRLFEDPAFVERYIARWKEQRKGAFSLHHLFGIIDHYADEISTAQVRNFVRWPSLGKTLLPDIRFLMFLGPHPDSWEGEIQYLKDWISERVSWMDRNIDQLRAL